MHEDVGGLQHRVGEEAQFEGGLGLRIEEGRILGEQEFALHRIPVLAAW